jgi:hypothetical protein
MTNEKDTGQRCKICNTVIDAETLRQQLAAEADAKSGPAGFLDGKKLRYCKVHLPKT